MALTGLQLGGGHLGGTPHLYKSHISILSYLVKQCLFSLTFAHTVSWPDTSDKSYVFHANLSDSNKQQDILSVASFLFLLRPVILPTVTSLIHNLTLHNS